MKFSMWILMNGIHKRFHLKLKQNSQELFPQL
ncbi:hypothetical protein FMEAI12_3860001 [Parafrankia sp. Ea1.12]|nr:hypothetical protein FMEAI12_3860001 [Parafrankia sp. Ea1.12]